MGRTAQVIMRFRQTSRAIPSDDRTVWPFQRRSQFRRGRLNAEAHGEEAVDAGYGTCAAARQIAVCG